MNYTRKRALLACDFCRHRKRRCDGQPGEICSTCRESNAECRYKDLPVDRVETSQSSSTGSDAVVERLSRIELLLEEQSQRLTDLARGSPPALLPSRFALPHLSPRLLDSSPASGSNRSPEALDPALDQAQFLIPHDHVTSTNSLLSLPKIRALVGDYPPTLFWDLEERLPLPPPLDSLHGNGTTWPSATPAVLDQLAQNYFASVNPQFPLFTPQVFHPWQARYLESGPSETVESAICLCVWALGSISPKTLSAGVEDLPGYEDLGLRFFQPALQIILYKTVWGFKPDIKIAQALLLAASYISHLGRPLHSWKLVYFAAGELLTYLESDCASELNVPRSGIEPLADRMPLPRSLDAGENDAIICFVAETAIRRLLNRIHSSLYSSESWMLVSPGPGPGSIAEGSLVTTNPGPGFTLNRLLALSSELNRQLEQWYHSIPSKLRPPIGTESIANWRGKLLRLRYYAARQVIHRPFVLAVAMQQIQNTNSPLVAGQSSHPQAVALPRIALEKCEMCISSCHAYVYNALEMLEQRSAYLWQVSQVCLSCLLVLTIAETSPALRPFVVPDTGSLFAMVVPRLRKWATQGSSFEAQIKILEDLATATR